MIVRNTKPFVTYVDDQFFYPGMNEIPTEKATQLSVHPAFCDKVAQGQFVIVGADATPATSAKIGSAVKIVSSLSVSTMNVENATKVIKGIFNKAELTRLQSTDMRKGIQEAISDQIKRIDAMAVPKAKASESIME